METGNLPPLFPQRLLLERFRTRRASPQATASGSPRAGRVKTRVHSRLLYRVWHLCGGKTP